MPHADNRAIWQLCQVLSCSRRFQMPSQRNWILQMRREYCLINNLCILIIREDMMEDNESSRHFSNDNGVSSKLCHINNLVTSTIFNQNFYINTWTRKD
jgi:hypothetical protein